MPDIQTVLEEIRRLQTAHSRVIVAIDGRCGSGKTTLAAALAEQISCTVLHMDDFFLRPEQRTQERLATPGGNVDSERFFEEVLRPLRAGEGFAYCPFHCCTMTLGEPTPCIPGPLTLVEGTYSCHPTLWNAYDLRIFLSVSPAVQRERILRRSGEEGYEAFRTRWIPLEEAYFSAFQIAERCDLQIINE